MHLHTGEWEQFSEPATEILTEKFPFPFRLNPEATVASLQSAEGILDQLDDAGVSKAVLFAVYLPHTYGITTNELVQERIDEGGGRFLGMASLSLERWDQEEDAELAELEKALTSESMLGIKLAPPHAHQRMDDDRYYSIYALAQELNKPVYVHTGSTSFQGASDHPAYTDPSYLEEAIQRYPGTQFILGHACYDFLEEDIDDLDSCLRLVEAYDNVWLEISALGVGGEVDRSASYAFALEAILARGLSGRTLYGSDGPQFP